jgi:peptide deformylase
MQPSRAFSLREASTTSALQSTKVPWWVRALGCCETSTQKTRGHHGTFVLCNAEVLSASRNEKAREGCMSVPDFTGDVKRASRLVVRGQLPGSGEEVTLQTQAFEARALQHEIDHCEGLLFLDRVAGAHAIHPRKTYL